ncbi:MAG TPA: glycosyltransferase family 39 protein [Pseudonocardiaceae bacterium]|nr:glycosyltransferase family 39 protein [Pseudonocardiaceae bacterium]
MVWLPVVCVAGLAIRLPALAFGLPGLNHPDEPTNIGVGVAMVDHGTLNPHYFSYPSLMYDVIAFVTWVQRVVSGHPPAGGGIVEQVTGVGHTSDPHLVLALRAVSLLLSVGAAVLVYVTVRRTTGTRWIAGIAGLALAVSPLLVTNGVFVAPDVYSEFFTAAALLGAVAIARRARMSDYVWTGLAVGLAVGSKFNTVMVVVAVLVAHVVYHRAALLRARQSLALLYFALCTFAAFFVTSPAALTDPREFVGGALFEVHHYATGHPGEQGGSAGFYLSTVFHDGPVLLIGAVAAVLALCAGRYRKEIAVAGTYAFCYAVLIAAQFVHFDRNALPLYPALAILLGLAVSAGVDALRGLFAHRPERANYATAAAGVVVAVAVLLVPLLGSLSVPATLDNAARDQARAWLTAHVTPGSRIVDESYGPDLAGTGFQVDYPVFAISQPVPADAAAIVVTQQGSGRYANQGRYPREFAAYHVLLRDYCTAATFTAGPWVRVLVPCG